MKLYLNILNFEYFYLSYDCILINCLSPRNEGNNFFFVLGHRAALELHVGHELNLLTLIIYLGDGRE